MVDYFSRQPGWALIFYKSLAAGPVGAGNRLTAVFGYSQAVCNKFFN